MNRLILDHFRRWWWVLALCGALEFWLGTFIAGHPQEKFEFWGLLVAIWVGANLLLMDLKNGMVRSVAVLPLTTEQIGLSWWLATVALPAFVLAALLFLGAGEYHWFHPHLIFPAKRLGLASLFNMAWLGIMFVCSTDTPGFHRKGGRHSRATFINLLAAVSLIGGMVYFQNAAGKPFKSALLIGLGVLFTAEGWFRAERFLPGRAGFRLVAPQPNQAHGVPGPIDENLRRLEALRPPAASFWGLRRRIFDRYLQWLREMSGANLHGEHRAPVGRGGIPLLINTVFVRTILTGASFVALMTLFMTLQGGLNPQFVEVMTSVFPLMFLFLIFFMQPTPALRQLRFLRTLPVSATRLAGVMFAMLMLPVLAVGALAVGVAVLAFGTPAAISMLKAFTFLLAPASLCICILVWRGAETRTNILVLLTLFGFHLASPVMLGLFLHAPIPLSQTGAFAAACVLLGFLLTRRAISHSSRAYLVPPNQSGNPWAAGR